MTKIRPTRTICSQRSLAVNYTNIIHDKSIQPRHFEINKTTWIFTWNQHGFIMMIKIFLCLREVNGMDSVELFPLLYQWQRKRHETTITLVISFIYIRWLYQEIMTIIYIWETAVFISFGDYIYKFMYLFAECNLILVFLIN